MAADTQIIISAKDMATDTFNKVSLSAQGLIKTLTSLPVLGSLAGLVSLDAIKDVALLAARYETLGVAMKVVGGNAGYTAERMDAYAEGLQKMGISATESRQNITRMTQAQLDLSKSSELARVAQDAAVIGGMNSSEAFSHMVQGIQSAQVEMLRTIGINVSFEESYQKAARASGRLASDLSEGEKAQIRMNAVLEAGKGIAGTYEAAMGTAGKQVTSLARYHEDLGVEIGKTFGPATTASVAAYTLAIKGLLDVMKGLNEEVSPLDRKIATIEREMKRVKGDEFATAGERKLQAERDRLLALKGRISEASGIKDSWLSGDAERKAADIRGAKNLEQLLKEQAEDEEAAIEEFIERYEALEKSSAEALKRIRKEMSDTFGSEREKRATAWALQMEGFDEAGVSANNPALKRLDELMQLRIKYTMSPDQNTALSMMKDSWQSRDEGMKEANKRAEKLYEEDLKLQTEFSEKHRAVVLGETDFKVAQIKDQAEAYKRAGADSVAVEQWAAAERLKISRNWEDGAIRGMREYADEATNTARGAERAFSGAFRTMEDSLVDMVMNGKASLSDLGAFARSVAADIARASIQASFTGPLASAASSALGSFTSGSGLLGSLGSLFGASPSGANSQAAWDVIASRHHTGGMAGTGAGVSVPSWLFAGARRYHSGGLAGDEVPAILQRGERVLNRSETAAYNGGGTAPVVNITVQNESGTPVDAQQVSTSFNFEKQVHNVVVKLVRTNRGFRNAFGMGGM